MTKARIRWEIKRQGEKRAEIRRVEREIASARGMVNLANAVLQSRSMSHAR